MTAPTAGQLLGYARVSTGHQSLDQQHDALATAGATKLYDDKLTGTSTREQRPGLTGLLDYAREGDTIVVVGIDRLGRNAAEVMTTIKTLLDKGVIIRALREGVDSATPTGRAVLGIMASLAELELELGKERREASRAARKSRGLAIGRPKALTVEKLRQAQALRASGEPVPEIAKTLGVGRATMYRALRVEGE